MAQTSQGESSTAHKQDRTGQDSLAAYGLQLRNQARYCMRPGSGLTGTRGIQLRQRSRIRIRGRQIPLGRYSRDICSCIRIPADTNTVHGSPHCCEMGLGTCIKAPIDMLSCQRPVTWLAGQSLLLIYVSDTSAAAKPEASKTDSRLPGNRCPMTCYAPLQTCRLRDSSFFRHGPSGDQAL